MSDDKRLKRMGENEFQGCIFWYARSSFIASRRFGCFVSLRAFKMRFKIHKFPIHYEKLSFFKALRGKAQSGKERGLAVCSPVVKATT